MIPRSGGEKNYLEAVYRPKSLATVFYGIQAICLSNTAAGCITFAQKYVLCFSYFSTFHQSFGAQFYDNSTDVMMYIFFFGQYFNSGWSRGGEVVYEGYCFRRYLPLRSHHA